VTGHVGPVEYVTSADGVAIAFQRFGQGPTILLFPTLPRVLRVHPEVEVLRGSGDLAQLTSVVMWDPRGFGMSDRDAAPTSLDAWIKDATAVAEAVGAPLPVYASAQSGPIAIAFAAQRPDLVSHLILAHTLANGAGFGQIVVQRTIMAVLDIDWDTCLEVIALVFLRLEGSAATRFIDIMRDEVDPNLVRQFFDALATFDARELLGNLDVPTLIIENRDVATQRQLKADGRELSRKIRGAQLIDGKDQSTVAQQILAFLDEKPLVVHGAFRTVMFTDLVSSTALTQQVGDEAAQQTVETHDAAVRQALTSHDGVEIKHTGDGIMAAFDSATAAARAAQQIAVQLREHGVGVRVGLNAGEPLERDGDLFGTAVQLAARVGDAANDGQVLATQVVRDLTAGKGLDWSPAPAIDAKGFDDPIPVFTLNLD
jgi:class 3 adenylate cyclase